MMNRNALPLSKPRPTRPTMPTGRAEGEPERKLDTLHAAMRAGDWREAMRIAAAFPRLGDEKAAITRAWEAYQRPDFMRQLRRDPNALIAEGVAALRRRYPMPEAA